MATLQVENVPDDLYEAILERVRQRRSSIAKEVIEVLRVSIPTKAERERREALYKEMLELQAKEPLTPGPHPSAEEMVREDRDR